MIRTLFVALLAALAQASGTWTSTGSLNIPRGGHTATLLASGQVLAVGGEDAGGFLKSAELYNPATGKWTVTGSMATPRIDNSATLLPNGELVASCENATGSLSSAELYNPTTGQWKSTGSIIYSGKASPTANCRLYDPFTNTWLVTGSLKQAVGHTATRFLNGQVLAVGGSDAELYTP